MAETTHVELSGLDVELAEPVAVALSQPGEERWGYHQFPAISRLPDGRLLVTFNDCPDQDDSYGRPGPAYVSGDEGQTWNPYDPADGLLTVSHSPISEVYDGERLCVPMSVALDIATEGIELPPPVGSVNAYGKIRFHKLSECPARVRDFMAALPAVRWHPADRQWRRESVRWDMGGALVRNRQGEHVVPRPYIDNRILRHDGLLYLAGYLQMYLRPDGSAPPNYETWCMVSVDNGRTWQRHGLVASDPTGDAIMAEPCLAATTDGGLACVIRCTDQRLRPMLIAHSADGGKTWDEPQQLHEFGVMPQTLLLDGGVMACSFGRPGVWMRFSPDGSARKWTEPLAIIPGDIDHLTADSCGYTRMLAVSENSFLLTYSHFRHAGPDGKQCKAIFVRKITVSHKRERTAR